MLLKEIKRIHALSRQVANFEDLISYCIGYGGNYSPSKPSIQISSLQTLRANAQGNLAAVTNAGTIFINATNARQAVFNPLKPLDTRIVNALDASEATDTLVRDAKTINRKIQGSRAKKVTKPDTSVPDSEPTETAKSISVSQQSYDSLLENFRKLIDLIASEPSYSPNEPDLQVATLQARANDMEIKNTDVINAITNLSNARIARNKTLYEPINGLYDIAMEVKKYVKSVFGATSPEYKQVSKIKFTKPKK